MPRKQLHNSAALLLVLRAPSRSLLQLVEELDRQRREIVDEVQRVLDFMRDPGGQLTKRGQLLGLDQPLLRGFQLIERVCKLTGTGFDILKSRRILNSHH